MAQNFQSELIRRHKAASTTVLGLIVGAILISVIAYLLTVRATEQDPPLATGALIAMVFFGIGAIVLRRTRFAAMRLQDIVALRGPSGLLQTLEKTTLQVAALGIGSAVIGLIATLVTGNKSLTYRGSVVAIAVLLYCYPTRTSWQRAMKQFVEEGALLPPKTTLT